MSGAPVLRLLPVGGGDEIVDQVARREQFEKARPDAVITFASPNWTGSILVCRKRLTVTALGLSELLHRLDDLAALDAEADKVARDFPEWRLWLSSLDRWWATWQGPDAAWTRTRAVPLTVTGDDLGGLRAQLADAQAAADRALIRTVAQ